MKKLMTGLLLLLLSMPIACAQPLPPSSPPSPTPPAPAPAPTQNVKEFTGEIWEIEGNLSYSQQTITDNTLIGIVNELERGNIVRQQIVSYDLLSREQETLVGLPVDRVVYEPPAVYGDSVVWSSVDGIEEEQQEAAKSELLPDFEIFLLDLRTGQVQQLTTEEHAQVSPRIYEDTIVWLDARNVEAYYNPRRYDVYAYDINSGTEKRLTAAPTAEGNDLSIHGNLVVWTDNRHADPPMDIHAGNEPAFNNEIYAYDLSTNREKRITDYPGNDRHPVIDGENIVWLRQVYQDYRKADVFLFNTVTGKETRISTSNYATFTPSINGNRIVWVDARASLGNTAGDTVVNGVQGQADIYLYDLATKQEVKISSTKPGDVLASPIIYGDYVVYTSIIMVDNRVFVVHLF
jgi:Tol biopolymer transport system component